LSLTIVSLILVVVFGLPAIAKFAGFLTGLRKSTQLVEKSDTTPPAPPRIEPLPEATNVLKLEIKGSTEPGASVVLFLNNKKQELVANRDGYFSYDFSLNQSENTISALAQDSAGNESQKTETYTVIFDNVEPSLEITSPEDGSEYYGAKQRQVVIEGKTEERVTLKINDRLVIIDEDGSFAFATSLSEGENTFKILAEDQAGNSTETSLTLHFTP
jgi:bacillopeptidase F